MITAFYASRKNVITANETGRMEKRPLTDNFLEIIKTENNLEEIQLDLKEVKTQKENLAKMKKRMKLLKKYAISLLMIIYAIAFGFLPPVGHALFIFSGVFLEFSSLLIIKACKEEHDILELEEYLIKSYLKEEQENLAELNRKKKKTKITKGYYCSSTISKNKDVEKNLEAILKASENLKRYAHQYVIGNWGKKEQQELEMQGINSQTIEEFLESYNTSRCLKRKNKNL